MERRRFRIEGVVQGVGFRWFAQRAAAEAGVTGWVRNERDGSVSAEAQGDAAALESFEAAVGRGPRWAEVTSVSVEALDPVPGERGFDVTH